MMVEALVFDNPRRREGKETFQTVIRKFLRGLFSSNWVPLQLSSKEHFSIHERRKWLPLWRLGITIRATYDHCRCTSPSGLTFILPVHTACCCLSFPKRTNPTIIHSKAIKSDFIYPCIPISLLLFR